MVCKVRFMAKQQAWNFHELLSCSWSFMPVVCRYISRQTVCSLNNLEGTYRHIWEWSPETLIFLDLDISSLQVVISSESTFLVAPFFLGGSSTLDLGNLILTKLAGQIEEIQPEIVSKFYASKCWGGGVQLPHEPHKLNWFMMWLKVCDSSWFHNGAHYKPRTKPRPKLHFSSSLLTLVKSLDQSE